MGDKVQDRLETMNELMMETVLGSKVHSGFKSAYDAIKDRVIESVKKIIHNNNIAHANNNIGGGGGG